MATIYVVILCLCATLLFFLTLSLACQRFYPRISKLKKTLNATNARSVYYIAKMSTFSAIFSKLASFSLLTDKLGLLDRAYPGGLCKLGWEVTLLFLWETCTGLGKVVFVSLLLKLKFSSCYKL